VYSIVFIVVFGIGKVEVERSDGVRKCGKHPKGKGGARQGQVR